MKRGRRRTLINKKQKRIITALAVLIFLAAILFVVTNTLKPVVQTICSNQAKILCTKVVNEAVIDELTQLGVDYDSLIHIEKDTYGNITAIETNAVEINKLKSLLTDAVNERLAQLPEQNVRIPLGTLTGVQLFSGRGPKIKLMMVPSSYAESTLENRFDSAGINQTRHQIMICFEAKMTTILVPYNTSVTVTTNICIAETVIIGAVPDTFANFNGITGQN